MPIPKLATPNITIGSTTGTVDDEPTIRPTPPTLMSAESAQTRAGAPPGVRRAAGVHDPIVHASTPVASAIAQRRRVTRHARRATGAARTSRGRTARTSGRRARRSSSATRAWGYDGPRRYEPCVATCATTAPIMTSGIATTSATPAAPMNTAAVPTTTASAALRAVRMRVPSCCAAATVRAGGGIVRIVITVAIPASTGAARGEGTPTANRAYG